MNTNKLGLKIMLTLGCAASLLAVAPAKEVKAEDKYAGREEYWNNHCSGIITDASQQKDCEGYAKYVSSNAKSEKGNAEDVTKSVATVKSDLSNVGAVAEDYQDKISDVNDEIASIEASMTNMQNNLASLDTEIKTTNDKIDARKKVVADRMVDMQSDANTNQFLNYVMGAEDLVDMVQRTKNVESFTKNDKEQIDLLNKEKKSLENQKSEQERMKSTLAAQKQALANKQAELEALQKSNEKMATDVVKKANEMKNDNKISKEQADEYVGAVTDGNGKLDRNNAVNNIANQTNKVNNATNVSNNVAVSQPAVSAPAQNQVSKPSTGNNTSVVKPTPAPVAPSVPASGKGAAIAAAAKAQLGVHQDCTMLVTNSLKAVGINFHGWPSEYLSLGSITSNPQPGDICVYGNAHVAIYIGNGQAVHGGWSGNNTAIGPVVCSTGSPVYVRVR